MKIITVAALKGGVGKTNFVFNLSTILALKKQKVLLIDLDPQGNLSRYFKISTQESKSKKLFLQNIKILNDEIIIPWNYKEINIDIIPTNISMTTLEKELIGRSAVDSILQRTFIKNLDFFNKYDYIIIDTSPSLNLINRNALLISDEIILISDNSIFSLDAINMLFSNWSAICEDLGIKNNINTIILNNFDHYKISKDFTEYITNSSFKNKILKTKIPRKQTLKKSEFTGIPSILLGKIENHIYNNLFNELKEREIL